MPFNRIRKHSFQLWVFERSGLSTGAGKIFCDQRKTENMNSKGVLQPGKACFFVTLRAQGKEGVFDAHPDWKTYVEGLWRQVRDALAAVDGAEFNVNGRSLHAVAFVSLDAVEDARTVLWAALEAFREGSEKEWQAYLKGRELEGMEMLWEKEIELREIEGQEELESLREFIVQKMLGGEELSDLGLDDEEDDGESFF